MSAASSSPFDRKQTGVSNKYGQSSVTQILLGQDPDMALLCTHENKVDGLFAGRAGRPTWRAGARSCGKADPPQKIMSPPDGFAGMTSHKTAVIKHRENCGDDDGRRKPTVEEYRRKFKGLAGKEGWTRDQGHEREAKRIFRTRPLPTNADQAVEEEPRPRRDHTKRLFHNASRNQVYVTEQFDVHGPSSWRVFDKDQMEYFEEAAGRATWERRWDRGKRAFETQTTVRKTSSKKSYGDRKYRSPGVTSCLIGAEI